MKNDLADKIIGVFHILEDSGKRTEIGKNVLWKVRCNICQNEKLLTYQLIKKYKSCGCRTKDLLSESLRKSLNRGGCGEIYATHWNTIKKNAKQRNLEFNITVEYAWNIFLNQNRKCALTGELLMFSTRCWSRNATASLDRIDSTKGYIDGNVQWVHKNINMMKQQYSTKLFFDWCKKVVLHNNLLCEKPFEDLSK